MKLIIIALLAGLSANASAGTTYGTISATIVSPAVTGGAPTVDVQRKKNGRVNIQVLIRSQPGASVSVATKNSVALTRLGGNEKLNITAIESAAAFVPDRTGNTHLALQGRFNAAMLVHAGSYTGPITIMVDYQ